MTELKGCPYVYPPSGGNAACANPKNGVDLLCYMTSLVDWQVRGYKRICLLGITELAQAILVHSLFYMCARYFAEHKLWGILGNLPSEVPPKYVHITTLNLVCNSSLLRVS